MAALQSRVILPPPTFLRWAALTYASQAVAAWPPPWQQQQATADGMPGPNLTYYGTASQGKLLLRLQVLPALQLEEIGARSE